MIDKRHIIELRERVGAYARPALSLYATVNPARTENNPQAIYVRVKNTLKGLDGVPKKVAQRVLDYFDGRAHQAKTLVLFADDERLDTIELEVEFLDDSATDRIEAVWGDPYFTPLLVAMDEHEPYAIVYADRDRLRSYELFMGQIDPVFEAARETVAEEEDEIGSSKDRAPTAVSTVASPKTRSASTAGNRQNMPSYVADRGDAAVQILQENIAAAQARFYKAQGKRVLELMETRGIARLIIMGPERDAHALLGELPSQAAERVVAVLPGTASGNGSPHEVMERVKPRVQEIEAEKERELLDAIRERGMWGLDKCLHALQEGRLHTIAVPGALHQDVFVDRSTNYVTLDEDEAKKLDGGNVDKVDLAEKLPELAAAWGARVEFVHGDAQRRLLEELGGMGGLRRW